MNVMLHDVLHAWINAPAPRVFDVIGTSEGTKVGSGAVSLVGNQDLSQLTPEELFSNPKYLPSATASLLSHSQARAKFHPADINEKSHELALRFGDYIRDIDANPVISLRDSNRVTKKFDSSDYKLAIDEVLTLYEGVSEGHREKIVSSIKDMVKSVFSSENKTEERNLFAQHVLNEDSSIIINFTTMKASHQKKGKSHIASQEYTVQTATYTPLGDVMKAYAPALAAIKKQEIHDWIGSLASPIRGNIKLCIEED